MGPGSLTVLFITSRCDSALHPYGEPPESQQFGKPENKAIPKNKVKSRKRMKRGKRKRGKLEGQREKQRKGVGKKRSM